MGGTIPIVFPADHGKDIGVIPPVSAHDCTRYQVGNLDQWFPVRTEDDYPLE